MALRAVVFDYGLVLTGPADPECHAALRQITGMPYDAFENLYWGCPERQEYDKGFITGLEYWRRFGQRIGRDFPEETVAELTLLDARMWTTENRAMVDWHRQVKAQGFKTAILSNMGDAITENIQKTFGWVHEFDQQVWSYRLRTGKPAPEIYLHVLSGLGTEPDETLFIDDRQRNLDGAQAVGLQTYLFRDVDHLRQDLSGTYSEWALPLPN